MDSKPKKIADYSYIYTAEKPFPKTDRASEKTNENSLWQIADHFAI